MEKLPESILDIKAKATKAKDEIIKKTNEDNPNFHN